MEILMEILGWGGAVLVLGAYAMVSSKRLPPDGLIYQGLNIAGSAALGIYAVWHDAFASVAVNVVWLMIGSVAVWKILHALKVSS